MSPAPRSHRDDVTTTQDNYHDATPLPDLLSAAESPAAIGAPACGIPLAANQVLLTLSYSLVSHVRHVAHREGVAPEDILVELISEGVTKRAFQEAARPAPSHLMTRTGYVPPEANGNVLPQPTMSHHVHPAGNGYGKNARGVGNGGFRNGNMAGQGAGYRNANGNAKPHAGGRASQGNKANGGVTYASHTAGRVPNRVSGPTPRGDEEE